MDVDLNVMVERKAKIAIVGAGLSGLAAGYELKKRGIDDFIIIEGRPHIGGRIQTTRGIDLGGTWFNDTHTELCSLLQELKLNWFEQFNEGNSLLIYNSMAAPHQFNNDTEGVSVRRVSGGSISLIDRLSEEIESEQLLNASINNIENHGEYVQLDGDSVSIKAESVILALPPKVIGTLTILPALNDIQEHLVNTMHTWMSNAIKVGISYEKPFWREGGFSGMMISQISPAVELYDHSLVDESNFSLMGFVNEGLRSETSEARREKVIAFIAKYLGEDAFDYLSYEEKDWSQDRFTSTSDVLTTYMSPTYGLDEEECTWSAQRIILGGAETSPIYGGKMEGAVRSGKRAAQLALAQVQR